VSGSNTGGEIRAHTLTRFPISQKQELPASQRDHANKSFFNSYNTRSNKVRVTKTPGGKLRYLHIKKRGTAPKCGDCGIKLPGVWTTPPSP